MTTQATQTTITGINYRVKENPEVGQLRPEGEVILFAEPENSHDSNAIAVHNSGHKIGYIKSTIGQNGLNIQQWLHDQKNTGKKITAKILDYQYATVIENTEETDPKKRWTYSDWNDEHRGQLAQVILELDADIKQEEKKKRPPYKKGDKEYAHVTDKLDELKPLYEPEASMKILKEWNIANRDGLKMSARLGTLIHELVQD